VPFDLPVDDLVPDNLPAVPLRGTASAPLDAFLAWKAELRRANFDCSNAAAVHKAASSARVAAKAHLDAAVAALDAAVTAESNASAQSASALQRRQEAWDQYLELHGLANSERSPSSSPSVASISPLGPDGLRASLPAPSVIPVPSLPVEQDAPRVSPPRSPSPQASHSSTLTGASGLRIASPGVDDYAGEFYDDIFEGFSGALGYGGDSEEVEMHLE